MSTENTESQKYYLLAMDYTKSSNNIVWWGPDNCGYTQDLNKAGEYTAEEIDPSCWDGDEDTIPVKKELADVLYSPRTIRNENENINALGITRKKRERKGR